MNRLAIIILNWNGADDAIKCASSLIAQASDVPDIIIVDNNSSDDSVLRLKEYIITQEDNNIHLIESNRNGGYTAGNNIGFRFALEKGYKFIGTLNPDAVADKNWTHSLINELESYSATGIVTGILAKSDQETIDSTGEQYPIWGIPGPSGRDRLLADAPNKPEFVFGSTGGGFIARADMLREIGLFDEKFFMYFEDVDLCFRAQLAGWKVRYTPKAIAYHKLSASTSKVPGLAITQTFKNLPILFTKNVPFSLARHIYPRFCLAYALILGSAIMKGRGIPALKGWLQSWALVPHMFRERKRIQSTRKVSDDYINSIILHDIPLEQTGLRKFRKLFTRK